MADMARGAAALPRPTVGEVYGHAWRQLWSYFLQLLIVAVVYLAVAFVGSFIIGLLAGGGDGGGAAVISSMLSLAFNVLVVAPLGFGMAYVYLRAARNESVNVGDLFVPFSGSYVSVVVASILVGIIVMIGFFLLILPGIFFAIRLWFVPFLVVDEGLGAMDAIKESWNRTGPHFWSLLGVGLLAIPIIIIGLLVLLIGVIPASMLTSLAYATIFAAVTAEGRGTAAF